MQTYVVSNESFETIARHVTLRQAAAIVGAAESYLASCIARDGAACFGQFDVDPEPAGKRAKKRLARLYA